MGSTQRVDEWLALAFAAFVSACSAERAGVQDVATGGAAGNAGLTSGGVAGSLVGGAAGNSAVPANGGSDGAAPHLSGSSGAAPLGGSTSGGSGGTTTGGTTTGGTAMGGTATGTTTGGTAMGGTATGGSTTNDTCATVASDYAAELEQQLGCDPKAPAPCNDRVAASPGCECRVFIEPADPFAIEHLSNVASAWFDADCSNPVCPAQCSTAQRGTCQADANSARGGRCKTP